MEIVLNVAPVSIMKFAPQIIFVVLIVGSGLFAWSWMVSDISGEYASSDRKQGHVSMSIIRKATTIKANLALGHGAMLEATVPSATSGQQLNWDFSVPQKWIDKGQVQRRSTSKARSKTAWSLVFSAAVSAPCRSNFPAMESHP